MYLHVILKAACEHLLGFSGLTPWRLLYNEFYFSGFSRPGIGVSLFCPFVAGPRLSSLGVCLQLSTERGGRGAKETLQGWGRDLLH